MTYITRIANKRIFAKICLLSFRSIIPIITFYPRGPQRADFFYEITGFRNPRAWDSGF